MDKIYIEHQVKFNDIQRAMIQYDLENDEDIKRLSEQNINTRKAMVKEN